MATPARLIRCYRVALALLCAAIAGWYSPFLATVGWRVLHPRGSVEYRGLHILVPWGWASDFDSLATDNSVVPEGISLRKAHRNLFERGSPQMIFVTVIAPEKGRSAEEQTREWLDDFRASHPGYSFAAAPPAELPHNVNCLSAQDNNQPDFAVWTCISVPNGWVVNYAGRAADVPVFFQVVAALRQ